MYPPEKVEIIKEKTRELLKEGWSYIQIAHLFGVDDDWLKELVPPPKTKKKSNVRSKPKKY